MDVIGEHHEDSYAIGYHVSYEQQQRHVSPREAGEEFVRILRVELAIGFHRLPSWRIVCLDVRDPRFGALGKI